jgi:hypothetical protein
MSGTPAAADSVVKTSSWLWMPLSSVRGPIRPGQRTIIGTRTPPSHVVIFSERNGVVPPWGNVECSTPLSLE